MANSSLGVKTMVVTVLPKHREALERFAEEFGYPGRSPALRRILDLSPELRPFLSPEEEPTPCPNTS